MWRLGVLFLGLAHAWQPLKVDIKSLQGAAPSTAHAVTAALRDSGLVAVDLGASFKNIRRRALRASATCIEKTSSAGATLEDGTVRRSLAAATETGFELDSRTCGALIDVSDDFTKNVKEVVKAMAAHLGALPEVQAAAPLLQTHEGKTYDTVEDIVEHGAHLEHFHAYRREGATTDAKTIDVHADQGLFIAFTPPLTQGDEDLPAATFSVELRDGTVAPVALESPYYASSVFVMLGDGVHQYLGGASGLRSAPHSVEMVDGLDRSWYGVMVLPPLDAVSPLHGAMTFGEVRDATRDGDEAAAGVGCARNLAARELAENQCEEDALFCWFRCMDLTNHFAETVSQEICEAQGMRLECTDIFRQTSDGFQHGDYYPQCTAYTHEATAFPSIAPADEEVCDDAYETAAAAAAETRQGVVDLVYEGRAWEHWFVPETVGQLAWTLSADQSEVSISHTVEGRVGWMAVGLRNPGGKKNGMNGAPVVMTIPDADEAEGFGRSAVDAYRISETDSSFRHWWNSDPGTDLSDAELFVAEGNCYAEATFTLGSWASSEPFDASACNHLIWAVSTDSSIASDDMFMARGMHETRGIIPVNFTDPAGRCFDLDGPGADPPGADGDGGDGGHGDEHGDHADGDHGGDHGDDSHGDGAHGDGGHGGGHGDGGHADGHGDGPDAPHGHGSGVGDHRDPSKKSSKKSGGASAVVIGASVGAAAVVLLAIAAALLCRRRSRDAAAPLDTKAVKVVDSDVALAKVELVEEENKEERV
mmetsp:Transcript_248/g.753  ORF Transcript_248/g.753 Transcript_248/m.753 type:complete len:761 (+) Transcript_248:114-2396(+)